MTRTVSDTIYIAALGAARAAFSREDGAALAYAAAYDAALKAGASGDRAHADATDAVAEATREDRPAIERARGKLDALHYSRRAGGVKLGSIPVEYWVGPGGRTVILAGFTGGGFEMYAPLLNANDIAATFVALEEYTRGESGR